MEVKVPVLYHREYLGRSIFLWRVEVILLGPCAANKEVKGRDPVVKQSEDWHEADQQINQNLMTYLWEVIDVGSKDSQRE